MNKKKGYWLLLSRSNLHHPRDKELTWSPFHFFSGIVNLWQAGPID